MGYEGINGGVESKGMVTQITHCPIGIDAARVEVDKHAPGVGPKIGALRELYKGRKIIVGRDKLDPTKGVLPKVSCPPQSGITPLIRTQFQQSPAASLRALPPGLS